MKITAREIFSPLAQPDFLFSALVEYRIRKYIPVGQLHIVLFLPMKKDFFWRAMITFWKWYWNNSRQLLLVFGVLSRQSTYYENIHLPFRKFNDYSPALHCFDYCNQWMFQ